MLKIFKQFEKWIITVLGIILGVFIVFNLFEIVVLIVKELTSVDTSGVGLLLNPNEIKQFLDLFFIILIAFELFETIRIYLKDNVFPAEYIVLVGIIALTRKIVLLDYDKIESLTIIGIGVLLIALSGSYYLLKKGNLLDEK
jgi:uncharacterized membrane protein (DUF373 family)